MSRVALGHVTSFAVESSTVKGRYYAVTRDGAGQWSCTCPSFEHRAEECKHIRETKENLHKERDRLRAVLEVFELYDPADVRARFDSLDRILGA